MKVIANKQGKLAINPRVTLTFELDDYIESGVNGLSEANIERLIELGYADLAEAASVEELDRVKKAYEFESITDKGELEDYARETYEVELDKRSSLKNMINTLKKTIEGDK